MFAASTHKFAAAGEHRKQFCSDKINFATTKLPRPEFVDAKKSRLDAVNAEASFAAVNWLQVNMGDSFLAAK